MKCSKNYWVEQDSLKVNTRDKSTANLTVTYRYNIFFLNIARHKSLIIGPEHCILIITSKKKIQILENVKNLTE